MTMSTGNLHGRHHRSRLRWLLAASAVLPTVACSDNAPPADPPATSTAVSSPAPTPEASDGFGAGTPAATAAPAGASYRSVDNLCAAVDLRPLKALFGAARDARARTTDAGQLTNMTCSTGFGLPLTASTAILATVYDDIPARDMYDGLRAVQQRQGSVTDVPGVGAAAYTYVDDMTGPHVVAYDGNLHVSVSVAVLRNSTQAEDAGIISRLIEVTKSTMAALRR